MQNQSAAYKAEQKEYLREKSYVWVYLGVISRTAQRSAVAEGYFADISKEQTIFGSSEFEAYYASPEENFTRVDDTMYFVPKDKGAIALNQGLVTANCLGSVTFTFGKYTNLDIKGLTLDFGDYYPTEFTVTNGTNTYTYTNNSPGEWVTEDEFTGTDYITVTPITMVGGSQRMRIHTVLFGKGFQFDNKTILSTTMKAAVSHLSGELPSKTFTFVVSNIDRKFAADDPHSFASFLEQEQEITYDYGRELADGSIFVIPGGVMKLQSWSSDDFKAQFVTVESIDFTEDTFYKGQYYPDGINFYDLAEIVLQDAGITKYKIDTFLKKLKTHNPLPPNQTHKALLQLIANATMSIIYEDRKGYLTIQSSFVPEMTSLTCNGAMPYSNLDSVIDSYVVTLNSYASNEKSYIAADSHQYFMPTNGQYIDIGYVSSLISGADGTFTTNPRITLTWEAKWSFYDIKIMFADVVPDELVVYSYADGVLVESFVASDLTDIDINATTIINHDFMNIDEIQIEFTKTKPYQRIHIASMRSGGRTEYTIDYKDMSASPTASLNPVIKDVIVNYTTFAYGEEIKDISSYDALSSEDNLVTFTTPYHGYQLAYKDEETVGTLTILESGAYYVKFTSTVEAEVQIKGIPFVVSESNITDNIHMKGVDKTSNNVLIDNRELAVRQVGWLTEYYDNDIEYIIKYRGEPAIDPDDLIYTENKYVSKNLVRIEEQTLTTSQGMNMTCQLKGRRVSYIETAKVNVAVVNESEVVGT